MRAWWRTRESDKVVQESMERLRITVGLVDRGRAGDADMRDALVLARDLMNGRLEYWRRVRELGRKMDVGVAE